MSEKYTKDNKLKVFTAFSGYDSQCLGLERLKEYNPEFDYELVGWSEINKWSCVAHDALFPQYADRNYGDISKIDWTQVPDFDLFTYSAPCQDWSMAGLQRGGIEGTGTRSSLLWECKKTIEIKRPKFCLLENVFGLLNEKFLPYFYKWIDLVNSFGYKSYYQVLNAKDYGVPQNRPRVFLVSVRNDVGLEPYYFPNPLGDDARPELYEILEPEEDVDPKFTRAEWRKKHYMELNENAIKRLEVPANEVPGKYDMKPVGLYCHCSDPFNQPPLYNLSRTLKTESIEAGILYKKDGEWYERLFTYRELFRLMGLKDSEFDILQEKVTSITHLQRMAGNSIVVNVLFHIFRKMFIDTEVEIGQAEPLF